MSYINKKKQREKKHKNKSSDKINPNTIIKETDAKKNKINIPNKVFDIKENTNKEVKNFTSRANIPKNAIKELKSNKVPPNTTKNIINENLEVKDDNNEADKNLSSSENIPKNTSVTELKQNLTIKNKGAKTKIFKDEYNVDSDSEVIHIHKDSDSSDNNSSDKESKNKTNNSIDQSLQDTPYNDDFYNIMQEEKKIIQYDLLISEQYYESFRIKVIENIKNINLNNIDLTIRLILAIIDKIEKEKINLYFIFNRGIHRWNLKKFLYKNENPVANFKTLKNYRSSGIISNKIKSNLTEKVYVKFLELIGFYYYTNMQPNDYQLYFCLLCTLPKYFLIMILTRIDYNLSPKEDKELFFSILALFQSYLICSLRFKGKNFIKFIYDN